MQYIRPILMALLLAGSACNAPTPTKQPIPSPSLSPQATASPTLQPSMQPSPQATAEPGPVVTPTPYPTPILIPHPSTEPNPWPTNLVQTGPAPTPRPRRFSMRIPCEQIVHVEFDVFQNPTWSADGKLLEWTATAGKGNIEDCRPKSGQTSQKIQFLDLETAIVSPLQGSDNILFGSEQWHPQDRKLLYTANQDRYGNQGLYLFEPQWQQEHTLLPANSRLAAAAWSPDGKLVAYDVIEPPNDMLYVLNLNTGNKQKIGSYPTFSGNRTLAWTPDQQSIAFIKPESYSDSPIIYVMALDGKVSEILHLLPTPYTKRITTFRWSPDGRYLAFLLEQDVLNSTNTGLVPQHVLYLAEADGQKAHPLGDLHRIDEHFSWSPDSRYLAVANAGGETSEADFSEIYTIEASTGKSIQLTHTDNGLDRILNRNPDWSPGGQGIVFSSNRATHFGDWYFDVFDIYQMRPDGSMVKKLTQGSYTETLIGTKTNPTAASSLASLSSAPSTSSP